MAISEKYRKLCGIGVDFCTPKGLKRYQALCEELDVKPTYYRKRGVITSEMMAKMESPRVGDGD